MVPAQKTIIVTGAGSGIGRETALHLARKGYAISCADLREAEAAATRAAITQAGGGAASHVAVNIAKQAECRAMAQAALDAHGRIDGLVNCAGISKPGDSLTYSDEDWERMIDIQLNGAFYAAQAVAAHMLVGGGSLVMITSTNAEAAFPRRAAYCAAKAGVAMLVKVLAIEWAAHKIRVNAVGPAYVATEMTKRNIAAGNVDEASINKRIPLGRMAQPMDVAQAVTFLLGEESGFVTGHSLYVDGGWLAYGYF
jgi:NAD(P)-dependent dehydrogenase (short-subunit alcohol dehydrogenase family)